VPAGVGVGVLYVLDVSEVIPGIGVAVNAGMFVGLGVGVGVHIGVGVGVPVIEDEPVIVAPVAATKAFVVLPIAAI